MAQDTNEIILIRANAIGLSLSEIFYSTTFQGTEVYTVSIKSTDKIAAEAYANNETLALVDVKGASGFALKLNPEFVAAVTPANDNNRIECVSLTSPVYWPGVGQVTTLKVMKEDVSLQDRAKAEYTRRNIHEEQQPKFVRG